MYTKEVISLVFGTLGVLLVPAVIWSLPALHRFRDGRNNRRG